MIKNDSIDRLKEEADIVQVVSNYVSLDKHNSSCCPFHDEKTPSFRVSKTKQMYKCFGCGASGDVFSFVMEHEGASFTEAAKIVAGITGFKLDFVEHSPEEKEKLSIREEQFKFNRWVMNHWKQELVK